VNIIETSLGLCGISKRIYTEHGDLKTHYSRLYNKQMYSNNCVTDSFSKRKI